MSAALSGGKQKQSAQNSSQMAQNVFGPQASALDNLYGLGTRVFAQNQQFNNQAMPIAQQNAQDTLAAAQPAWQQQLQGGAYANLGIGNQLMQSLQQSQNTPSNMQAVNGMIMGGNGNNYADAMKASFSGDANRAADNMMRTLDARATGSGMSGGSRHGLAEAQGFYDVNSNLQHNLAQVGYNTFDKDLDRKLNIAQQADQGSLGRQQLMAGLLNNQNQAQAGAIQFGEGMQNLGLGTMAPASAGWGNFQGLSNAIGQPTILSSGTSTGSQSGSGWNMSPSASLGSKGIMGK